MMLGTWPTSGGGDTIKVYLNCFFRWWCHFDRKHLFSIKGKGQKHPFLRIKG